MPSVLHKLAETLTVKELEVEVGDEQRKVRIACCDLCGSALGLFAFRHLIQYSHHKTWQRRWPMASTILHKTGLNKHDEAMGVAALLPGIYKQGLARIPHRHGDLEALNFVRAFRRELTQWPESSSSDLMMAHWMAEWNLGRIIRAGRHGEGPAMVDPKKLPPYLRRRLHEVPLGEEALA
jgi:hypothetical protein